MLRRARPDGARSAVSAALHRLPRAGVRSRRALCAACWQKIQFLDGPMCACCGLPFELDPGGETLCAACHASPPAFDKARAVMRYDEKSRGPILALKHADRLDLTPAFARWLERGGRALLDEADLILPVPLHPSRLWSRRYNQSAELARVLGRPDGQAGRFRRSAARPRTRPARAPCPRPGRAGATCGARSGFRPATNPPLPGATFCSLTTC